MYNSILVLHSLVRWLLLFSLIFGLYRAYYGWKSKSIFGPWDNRARHVTATIAHVQLIFGLWLYFISPIVNYFFENFREAVHMREIRFFGMEHVTMMTIAITLLTVGSIKVKKKSTDQEKFKTMLIWYSIVLVIIFLSIPWKFSPFTARPYFRFF